MKNFVISYDLHNSRDYSALYRLLAAWKAIKLTESQWLVTLATDAMKTLEIVASTLDGDDAVTVLELTRGAHWATIRVPTAASNWLSNNVTPIKIAA